MLGLAAPPCRPGRAARDCRSRIVGLAAPPGHDLVALSYWQTYGVPVCVTRFSNNYGPSQHPEKMIPRSVTSLLKGGKITLHGRGEHVRNWLHVEDNCAAIDLVMRDGTPGGVYNVAGTTELANRDGLSCSGRYIFS